MILDGIRRRLDGLIASGDTEVSMIKMLHHGDKIMSIMMFRSITSSSVSTHLHIRRACSVALSVMVETPTITDEGIHPGSNLSGSLRAP